MSSVSNMAEFAAPGAEKLYFFWDKISASSIDIRSKHKYKSQIEKIIKTFCIDFLKNYVAIVQNCTNKIALKSPITGKTSGPWFPMTNNLQEKAMKKKWQKSRNAGL